jgi:hypothetical protein|tara:strand:+ start:1143 stop:1334 length:192 start_codon:yes stop_codon:yes gene_type:complete
MLQILRLLKAEKVEIDGVSEVPAVTNSLLNNPSAVRYVYRIRQFVPVFLFKCLKGTGIVPVKS